MLRIVLLGLWIVALAPVVLADFDAGLTAYQRAEYETALAEFQPMADQGHARAQYYLGLMYASGHGTEISLREALRWYRAAAEQGYAEAQNALAYMYRVGNGVPKSEEEAAKWYGLAAEQGVGQSQFNLASMYGGGRGVPQDYVQSYKWFSLSAMHGVDGARVSLFFCVDRMTEEEVAEAQRLASEWRPRN